MWTYFLSALLAWEYNEIQDYVGIYGLKIWQEEYTRVMAFFVEQVWAATCTITLEPLLLWSLLNPYCCGRAGVQPIPEAEGVHDNGCSWRFANLRAGAGNSVRVPVSGHSDSSTAAAR